jgi:hypothetical protein
MEDHVPEARIGSVGNRIRIILHTVYARNAV